MGYFVLYETNKVDIRLDPECDNPFELNKILNDYNYWDGDKDKSNYRTLSPKQFAKYKHGSCWDFTEYEAYYFKRYFAKYKFTLKPLTNHTYSLYYMQVNNGKNKECPSHSWLAFMKDNKVYIIESAWGEQKGVHSFNTEKEMIDYYFDKHNIWHNKKYCIVKYKPMKDYNLTPNQFMKRLYDNCEFYHYSWDNDKNYKVEIKYKIID